MSLERMLNEIKERAEKATPGEWKCRDAGSGMSGKYVIEEWFIMRSEDDIAICDNVKTPKGKISKENAEFIAHARTDIPRLLEALKLALYYIEGDATYEGVCLKIEAILQGEAK